MGEWSEYFEDFPEENPANYIDGHFDPASAAQRNKSLLDSKHASAQLRATIKQMQEDGKRRAAAKAELVKKPPPGSS